MTPMRTSGMVVWGAQGNCSPTETLIKLVKINIGNCSQSLEMEGFTTNGETLTQENLWKLSRNGSSPWYSSPSSHSSALPRTVPVRSAITWHSHLSQLSGLEQIFPVFLADNEHGQIPFSIFLCCRRTIASEWWQLGGIHFLTHNFHYERRFWKGSYWRVKPAFPTQLYVVEEMLWWACQMNNSSHLPSFPGQKTYSG